MADTTVDTMPDMDEPPFNPSLPELITAQYLIREPLPRQAQGKVVVSSPSRCCAPGARHALPWLRLAAFRPEEVAVVGLHMVFENHKDDPAMLEKFKDEHLFWLVDKP